MQTVIAINYTKYCKEKYILMKAITVKRYKFMQNLESI